MAIPWVIFGCRTSYAAEVAEIIWRRGDDLVVLIDNIGGADPIADPVAPVIDLDEVDDEIRRASVVIPLLTPGHRHTVSAQVHRLGFAETPVMVDPTAVIARTASLGPGAVVNAAAVIGAKSVVGEYVHLNRSASIGHDAVIGDFVTFGPGSLLAGHVTVGRGAFLGAGAVCAPGVTIGANSIIGAGAVVVRDVPDGAVVVGNPATVLRTGPGYGGVGVPER